MTTVLMKKLAPEVLNVERIFSSGAVVIQKFEEEGPTVVTLANRTLTLLETRDLGGLEAVQNPEEHNNLDFEWKDRKFLWNENLSLEQLKMKESFFFNGFTF